MNHGSPEATRSRIWTPQAWVWAALALCACGERYWICDDTDQDQLAQLPDQLSDTGLFSDLAHETLAPGVFAYAPQFPLWSDGAEKRRWIWLPPGKRIDTSDMDAWRFPEGTKFWKEFTRDGVRVETRLLQKVGPGDGDWLPLAYIWTADQREAIAAPYGAIDAGGTPHNVPASAECGACHRGRRSYVLGFSAIQLSSAEPGRVSLASLASADLLSDAPQESYVLPGSDVERAALGYLHANCSHCHNQDRPEHGGARCFDPETDLDFGLSVHALSAPADTATYRSAIGPAIKPEHPEKSRLIELMTRRGFGGPAVKQMPPLASERVDHDAVDLLKRWIRELRAP
jgi:hypothetical protein